MLSYLVVYPINMTTFESSCFQQYTPSGCGLKYSVIYVVHHWSADQKKNEFAWRIAL